MARSLNRVQLIGNLTRDPELRYTPSGTAVCSFAIATNRSWKTETGEKKEEAEFHRIVSWNKLAELCSQFLVKGRKVYLEGRLATRNWTAQDGTQKTTTEIVISDMILLDSRRPEAVAENGSEQEKEKVSQPKADRSLDEKGPSSAKASDGKEEKKSVVKEEKKVEKKEKATSESVAEGDVAPDDIPF